MSTYYDIHCRTCDESAGFEIRGSFGIEQLATILRRVDVWEKLAGVAGSDTDVDLKLMGDEAGGIRGFPRFAAQHHGHDLAIRSEFGDFADRVDCGHQLKCPSCTRMLVCTLVANHAGEHQLIPFVSLGGGT